MENFEQLSEMEVLKVEPHIVAFQQLVGVVEVVQVGQHTVVFQQLVVMVGEHIVFLWKKVQ